MIKVGIIGATGYTGLELIRLIYNHPQVTIIAVCSRNNIGLAITKEFPSLIGFIDLHFIAPDDDYLLQCDLIFFATPHGIAMKNAAKFIDKGIKIIDLSADFRVNDDQEWSKWYNVKHIATNLLKQAVYGLPEIHQDKIKNANLVANPGCYPTAIILALIPLLKINAINNKNIIADCKSGISGAGKGANVATLFCETSDSIKPYGVNHHRHQLEIKQELENIANTKIDFIFVPHLMPMIRGMLATIYVDLINNIDAQQLFEEYYQNNQFVHILSSGTYPQTRSVKSTNNCQISIKQTGNKLIIMSVIDNLVKGAAGQAVQNMNIMFGLPQNIGLDNIAINP